MQPSNYDYAAELPLPSSSELSYFNLFPNLNNRRSLDIYRNNPGLAAIGVSPDEFISKRSGRGREELIARNEALFNARMLGSELADQRMFQNQSRLLNLQSGLQGEAFEQQAKYNLLNQLIGSSMSVPSVSNKRYF